MLRKLVVFYLLFAWIAYPSAAAVSSNKTQEIQSELDKAKQELNQAQQQILIAEAADQIEDNVTKQAYSRFEIWTGSLIGFFSVLITILVIVFGFRTEKAAAAAAAIAATDAAKKELAGVKEQIDLLLDDAKSASAETQAARKQASKHATTAQMHREGIEVDRKKSADALAIIEGQLAEARKSTPRGEDLNLKEISTVAKAASISSTKPMESLTADELKVRIGNAALVDKDFESVVSLSHLLESRFSFDRESVLFALEQRGEALLKLNRLSDAVHHFTKMEKWIQETYDEQPFAALADCFIGKGRALSWQKKFADAETAFREALDIEEKMYGEDSSVSLWTRIKIQEQIFEQGRIDEIPKELEEIISASERHNGKKYIRTLLARFLRAKIIFANGDFAKARKEVEDILSIQKDTLQEDSPYIYFTEQLLNDISKAEE